METFDGMDHLAGLVGELRDYAVLAGEAPTAVEQWELARRLAARHGAERRPGVRRPEADYRAEAERGAPVRRGKVMASMRGENHDAERLTADECDRRAVTALEKAGRRGLSAAGVGYRIWPDRRFDARGAGFAAIRVLRRLEKAGKAYQSWGEYNATWFARERGTRAAKD